MDLPRYCRDCCFRAERKAPYGCAYALLTGRTRHAQAPGEGCSNKVKGDRYTEETIPKELMPEQKPRKQNRALTVKKTYNRIDDDRCMVLYQAGWTDRKIGAEFGVTEGAVAQWRKRRHLPATKFKKGTNDMPRGKQAAQTAPQEKEGQASAKELRDWGKEVREYKETLLKERTKLKEELELSQKKAEDLQNENDLLKKQLENYKTRESDCQGEACEGTEPAMALSVLTGLLGKISEGWPQARLTGNTNGCKALALHVLYGGDGKERNVEVQLLN